VLLREQARLGKYVWGAPLVHQPHTLRRDRNNLELVHHKLAQSNLNPLTLICNILYGWNFEEIFRIWSDRL
jgi:hypothetical protein